MTDIVTQIKLAIDDSVLDFLHNPEDAVYRDYKEVTIEAIKDQVKKGNITVTEIVQIFHNRILKELRDDESESR
jgi:hypothetical protein